MSAQGNFYNPYVDEQVFSSTAGNSLRYCKWRGTITEVLVYLDTLVFPSTCIYPIPVIGRPGGPETDPPAAPAWEDEEGYGHAGYDDGRLLIEKISAGTLKAGATQDMYVRAPRGRSCACARGVGWGDLACRVTRTRRGHLT